MGVVYQAKDTKLARTVALKFLPPQWSHDEGAKQRFLREAQAASASNHRNICVIHDIEQTDDGQLFIVMAYYEGETLKRRLERGAFPIAEALEIAAEVAEGLAKAHAQGVVHRDIKPGNLIVTEDGVKILDFGLAKFADALQLTQPGSTLGTVAYMAPEQARGEEADERSDVWALGVVLYEMLAGELPFKGTYPEAIFYAIKNETPAPLTRPGRDVPEAVERVVMRALTRDSGERYQNAREFARELRFLQGRSLPLDLRTEALDVQRAAAAAQNIRPKRFTIARVTAAIAVLTIVAGVAYAWLARPLTRIPVAVIPVANHTGEPELDPYRLALTQSLITELGDSPNLHVAGYASLLGMLRRFTGGGAADPSGQEALQFIASQSGATVLVVPSLEYRNGAWLAHGELRNVSTGTNIAVVETPAVTSSLPKDTVQTLVSGLASKIQDHFKVRWPHGVRPRSAEGRFRTIEAARAFEAGVNAYDRMEYAAALSAFRNAVASDPQRAIARGWLSRTSLVMGDTKGAEAAGRAAAQLLTAATPTSDALFTTAALAEAQKDLPVAEEKYRQLAALHPDDASGQLELADFLKRQTRNERAVEGYLTALKLDPGVHRARVDLCQLYSRLDNYPLSEQHAQTALKRFREMGDRGGEAQALLCYGDALLQQGTRLKEARGQIEAARGIFLSLNYSYNLSRVYQYLGLVAGREHDFPAAAQSFEEALSRSRQVGNKPIEGLALMNLGVAHDWMGHPEDAARYHELSRDVYQEIGDERRAAEQEYNAAAIRVNSDPNGAYRRLANARATFHALGYVDFEVSAMKSQAESLAVTGRFDEALRLLREAASIATERQLKEHLAAVKVSMGNVQLLQRDYEAARKTLEEVVATPEAPVEAEIALGRAYVRLGDKPNARKHLESGLARGQKSGEAKLVALAEESLRELSNGQTKR